MNKHNEEKTKARNLDMTFYSIKYSKEHKEILDKLNTLIYMNKMLLRQRHSNKIEILETEVMNRPRMKTLEVMNFLGGVRRQTALDIMRELGKTPDFRFDVGNSASKKSSVIIYLKSEIRKKQFKILLEIFSNNNVEEVTINKVMEVFSVDVEIAKLLAYDFVKEYPNFEIQDGNKIVRKSQKPIKILSNHKDLDGPFLA